MALQFDFPEPVVMVVSPDRALMFVIQLILANSKPKSNTPNLVSLVLLPAFDEYSHNVLFL